MIQQKKKIKTNNLDLSHLNDSHLSIQFSLDGFSFCILNKDTKSFTALYDFSFKELNNSPKKLMDHMSEIFRSEEILNKEFHTVNVSHINTLSTLVPKPLFDENELKNYIRFNTKIFEYDYLVHDEIKNHDIINVYIPYVNINNFLLDRFGGFEYKHFSTILIENLMSIYRYSLVPHLFAYINDGHFEIMVIADKKLLLYNTFTFNTKEDFIYYILFTAEQLRLNPEKFECILLGDIQKDDDLFNIAYTYIRNVSLLENRYKYGFEEGFTEWDKRRYYTLLNQY